MFHDFKIVLDSPPRGFYTYEDEVSGSIVFESSHEGKIGWVYVFFHGWVHAQIFRTRDLQGHIHNYPLKEKQKEILVQTHLKLYEGTEKLRKKVRYEWPFTFSFQDEEGKGETLPTSGKYLYEEDQNAHCSVEYKVVVVRGDIGQMDNHVRSMLDRGDLRYREEGYSESAGFLTRLREKMDGAAEQQLRFVQIRPNAPIDQSMRSSSSTSLNIASHQLPHSKDPQDYDYLTPILDDVNFKFDIQIPRNIIIGEAFPLLLSVSSLSELWNQNPPCVILTYFKLGAWIEDIATINGRSDEELKMHLVGERKHLKVPLGAESVDLGTIYGFTLAGDGIVPSFRTNLLERKYSFRAEFTAEVAGKVYPVLISISIEGRVLSPLKATKIEAVSKKRQVHHPNPQTDLARPIYQRDTASLKLQRTHIGRFSQQVESAHGNQSIMEAAIALSKMFTEAGVQHSFPGDFTMELLPYIDYDESFAPSSDDVGKLQRLFAQKGSQFQVLTPVKSDAPEIQLLFKNFGNSGIETVVIFSGNETHRPSDLTFAKHW
ncbi:hypothetical protein NA56DRAFT_709733 [Hyaloscypha hepaticicola]|uniref:Arrestin-like N-terminal domain-containing protein n=1 Tax=Hyaloscypha hepaticicola TaxID=2082293 RepID=A0A2J6PNJ8_9HELO|nr:hypothetical protein NA56DRAFT_709733 [Hyaloscypha hepaticicola]